MSTLHIKSWLNDFYSEDNASRCKSAYTTLYKDWLVASVINQLVMCVNYVFCVVFVCWMIHGDRWCCQTIFGRPDIARVMHLLEDGERLRVVDRILYSPRA